MRRLSLLQFLFCVLVLVLFIPRANASSDPQSGSSSVDANVNNPSLTPTPQTFLSSTPTPTANPFVTPTPTTNPLFSPTPTPTSAPGQEFYLDISGFASPYASIVMTSSDVFVRAATADSKGNFYISQIGVQTGFTSFCLENIDFQKIGDSISCFKIPPVTASTSKKDIFLPPSLGLSSRKTTPLTYIYAFGYTMPGSDVSLSVSKEINLKATAGHNGYYSIKVSNLAVGTYELFATAQYQKKDSVKPSKTQEVKSLTPAQLAKENLITTITGFLIRYGWIAVPILILIFILLSKRLRDRLITVGRGLKDRGTALPKEKEHLHHYWFVGY